MRFHCIIVDGITNKSDSDAATKRVGRKKSSEKFKL